MQTGKSTSTQRLSSCEMQQLYGVDFHYLSATPLFILVKHPGAGGGSKLVFRPPTTAG
jgi:hypothetical protein